jgi:hypothetical protein
MHQKIGGIMNIFQAAKTGRPYRLYEKEEDNLE